MVEARRLTVAAAVLILTSSSYFEVQRATAQCTACCTGAGCCTQCVVAGYYGRGSAWLAVVILVAARAPHNKQGSSVEI